MCGIAGIVGPAAEPGLVERMIGRLRHRGPDHAAVWSAPGACLGHARLSILDLSTAGNQPMSLGDLTITYNGEIYNYRSLKNRLPGPFRSSSDTEVVLQLWAAHGKASLQELAGMFAFAMWDQQRRRLTLVRDRLGIKPLFYRELPDGLAFASEIKALLELGRPSVDHTALRDFFTYKYVPEPKTAYVGIRKLEPGRVLVWDGKLRIERFWDPSDLPGIDSRDEALARLDTLLRSIVPAHTLADVPVGVFLSGGIDSTTLAAHLDRPLTLTLGCDIRRRDETGKARQVAQHFQTIHHEEIASSIDLDEALDVMPGVFDEPFGDTGGWATWLVARLARRHVVVALSGEGGDELFLGYHWYGKWLRLRSTALMRRVAGWLPPFFDGARSAQRRAATGLERYAAFVGPFTREQRQALLGPELVVDDYDDLWHLRRFWRDDLEPLKRMQWADLHTFLPGDLLTKVDRASMAHSLEVRPPLLDHRLVEFALALDSRLLFDQRTGRGKLLLRQLMEKRVPGGLFDLPKRGFNLPFRDWVRRRPELLTGALDRLHRLELVRRPAVHRFTNEQTWSLLFFDRWLEKTGATW